MALSARMRNRLLAVASLFVLLPLPAAAQDPRIPGLPRSLEMLQRATSPDTVTGVRRHLRLPLRPAAFELSTLFSTRPLGEYLEQYRREMWVQAEAAPRRFLQEARFVDRTLLALENSPDAPAVTPADTSLFLPPLPAPVRRAEENPLGGLVGQYADIGIAIQGQGDLGGAWTRHRPCDPAVYFNCNPGLMPELKPDVKFGIVVGGTISDRVHVDVDYDQSREFDAANNINVYYQGLADEVLQRVEVGDVSLRLPSSRYMTRGVPAGNFGFMASGQVGPLELQTVFAQQKGDLTTKEFRFNAGNQTGVEQDATLEIDDADYVKGQFFFIVPPSEIFGTPHVDALSLRSSDAPVGIRPGLGANLVLYRDERLSAQSGSAQLGYFLADALPPGGGMRHTGSFRRLQPDEYIVHSSGLWFMLRSPLRSDEALAVSYVTEKGDTIGVINAESSPPGTTPQLRLLRGPYATHQPGAPTWDMEMHQVYRLDSSTDVDLNTVELTLSLGGLTGGRTFREVLGQQVSFLRFFGLDEDSPTDRLDAAQVYQPARDGFTGAGSGTPIGGTYIIFPTLRPFAQPAPVQTLRLSSEDLVAALGRDANDAIYADPDPVTRDASGRFRLNFKYRVKVEGIQSSFALGAIGLREGSERLFLGSRLLVRDADYIIDYDLGTVTLKDPQQLFATSPGAEIRATWEQKPMFNIAPTSMMGFHARYRIGARGDINVVGLYQAQQSLMSRPQLGVEPGSALLGGVSGTLNLGGALLDRLVSSTGLRSVRASAVNLTGELAFSAPDPNPRGVAWLDDFEATDEIGLRPHRMDWKLASAPQSTAGDAGVLPFSLDASTALPLVWQHDYLTAGGEIGGAVPPSYIDEQINIVGQERPEAVMWLTWGYPQGQSSPLPPPPDERRWRSVMTTLSTTGRDMTRSEYLEFYVFAAQVEPMSLVFDIGTISEDAFYMDAQGNTEGEYEENGRQWGLRVLDEEARLIEREVWGTDKDALGLWDQECVREPLVTYPIGDPRVNCTRGNGLQDTEDLNGNGILDADDGQYFRYVVRLDEHSEYLVRDTQQTGTLYRLYRIPLRSGEPVNGANDGTWRFIRHLRMTVAGEPKTIRTLAIARMRIIGSRWTKRDVYGVMQGMFGDEPGVAGGLTNVEVGPVGRITVGSEYAPPPGVREEAQDPTQQYGPNGAEINEKGLRLAYSDLQPDERAEVYFRYPQQPRNMLMYSELRLWAIARAGRWGVDDGERFSVRVGTDPRNFYMYQTKLKPATGAPIDRDGLAWLPELVIDTRQWQELKAIAERQLIERGAAAGVDTVWSADSSYAVVLEDRARAPNLAAVRELTFAVYNAAGAPTTGEVWINDLRTNVPDRRRDMAGNIGLDIVAGDLMTGSVSFSNYGALYRQLGETPSYVGGRQLNVSTEARLDRLLPVSWGVDLPLSVTHTNSADAPTYLTQSDVLADRLDGLRASGSSNTRVGLRISKRTPTANPLLSLLLDGSALRLGWNSGSNSTVTSRGEQGGFNTDLSYRRDLAPRTFRVPGLFGSLLRALAPERVEASDPFRRLAASRFRWSPSTLSFGTSYDDQMTRSLRYEKILEVTGDTAVAVFESPRQALRSDAQLGFQFFEPLTLNFALSSERDMLASEVAATRAFEQGALERERMQLGGVDLGWETTRALTTTFNYRPQITNWLRFAYTFNNRYLTDRNPSFMEVVASDADTTATLQRRFESARRVTRQVTFEPRRMAPALGLDSTSIASRLLRRFVSLDVRWNNTLTSAFERELFVPGIGYQLGLGDLSSFTLMQGDTAVRAQELSELRIGTSTELTRSLTLSADWSRRETETFDPRGGNRAQSDVSPNVTLLWRDLKLPGRVGELVTTFSGRIGVTHRETTSFFRGPNRQERGGTDLSFPFSVILGLPHAVTIGYDGSLASGETSDPTGSAERGTFQHNFRVSTIFQPPESLRAKLNGPIEVQLAFVEQQQSQCRYVPGLALAEGCVAFLDVGTRTANLQVATKLSDLDVGMLLNYVGRDNHIGQQNGSTQFQLQMYARFNFTAGQLPGLRLPQ